ncbi:MAG: hypothetical protein MUQ10_12305, partial [Anaerolineae bacterium]|nr:hypothetical protein [Anaerolineae bacterium]
TTSEVAMLDVVDDGGSRLLGVRRLRGTDFRQSDVYQEFAVDFVYPDAGSFGVEFRTWYRATADLYLGRVLVVEYPIAPAGSVEWELSPGNGDKIVFVKFIDGAGNVSADTEVSLTRWDGAPPGEWSGFSPACWQGDGTPVFSVRVRDAAAGLDVSSALYRYSSDGRASWSGWLGASCTGSDGTTDLQTITTGPVSFGAPSATQNWVEFLVEDMAEQEGSAQFAVRNLCMFFPFVVR